MMNATLERPTCRRCGSGAVVPVVKSTRRRLRFCASCGYKERIFIRGGPGKPGRDSTEEPPRKLRLFD